MVYNVLKALASALMRLLYRIDIVHKDRIPESGALIICANHIHIFDPVLLAMSVDRQIHFMAKAELFTWPIIGCLVKKAGTFPVKRGSADIQAIKHSIRILTSGGVLGIFPEGTRSKTGEMNEPFQGITMLAEKTGATIVPAAISGEYKFRGRLKIVLGAPLTLQDLCADQEYNRAQATGRLMDTILSLKETTK